MIGMVVVLYVYVQLKSIHARINHSVHQKITTHIIIYTIGNVGFIILLF
jgi:hypothetical protein